MSICKKTLGVVAALTLVALPSITLAQGASRAAYNQRFDRAESRRAQNQQVAYYEEGVYDEYSGGGCDSCGGGGCDSCGGDVAGCGNCGDACCGGCGGCGFYMLYENVIAQPFFTRDPAYFSEGEVDNTSDSWEEYSFDWNAKYSPRVEIGFQPACGLGIRARYWYYDNEATVSEFTGDAQIGFADNDIGIDRSNTEINARHSLDLDVTDLEITASKGGLIYAGGLRYVRMDQEYSAYEIDDEEIGDELAAWHNFEGVGPTVAVEGSSGPRWCGFGVFAKARGSLLYGDSSTYATDLNATNPDVIIGHTRDDLISIAELQIGVDWQRCCHWGTLYLSAALEAQYWFNAGSGAPGLVDDDDLSYHDESAYSSDLGFLGGTFGAGILW
jgi:hypothetical protein